MTDIPIYVDTVLQQSILQSGLALLRLTVMIPIGAVVGGWLCNRFSCRWVGMASLLLTMLGFFLMSQWPVQPSELQLTISTLITGLGFGLVIAPIGTTTINAVRPSQAGVASAIVTALRMVGMTLGLSLLTSWALAHFQQLAAQYPTLSLHATSAQFNAWSKGYAAHLTEAAHATYCSVFLISSFICLVALVPAFFLWGRQAPLEEPEGDSLLLYEDEINLSPAVLKQRQRRRVRVAAILLLTILVSAGALTAEWFRENALYGSSNTAFGGNTSTGPSGSKMLQVALDKDALTSLFTAQLGGKQSALSDLSATPGPNDSLGIKFSLHIDGDGIQRVIPVEIDGKIGLDKEQNLQLTVQQFKRDGQVADANSTANMQNALSDMLASTVTSTLHNQLKGTKLISVHTSTTVSCAQKTEMLVIQVQASAGTNLSTQAFCLKGPVDLKKLFPQ
jgi:MFS family permease